MTDDTSANQGAVDGNAMADALAALSAIESVLGSDDGAREKNEFTFELPIGEAMALIPEQYLKPGEQDAPEKDTISVTVEDLFNQLRRGRVSVKMADFAYFLPSHLLTHEAFDDRETSINLPLATVVQAINMDSLKKRTSQRTRRYQIDDLEDPFAKPAAKQAAAPAEEAPSVPAPAPQESGAPAAEPEQPETPPEAPAEPEPAIEERDQPETVEEPPETPVPAAEAPAQPPPVPAEEKAPAAQPEQPETPPETPAEPEPVVDEPVQPEAAEEPPAAPEPAAAAPAQPPPVPTAPGEAPTVRVAAVTPPEAEAEAKPETAPEAAAEPAEEAVTEPEPAPEAATEAASEAAPAAEDVAEPQAPEPTEEPEPQPEPVDEEPEPEQPAEEEPAAEQPAPVEEPAAETPIQEAPAAEKATAEEPATEQPAPQEPAATPAAFTISADTAEGKYRELAGNVNLNTATAQQLMTLEGVTPQIAEKIIEARTERGGFDSVFDLVEIPRLGRTTFRQITGMACSRKHYHRSQRLASLLKMDIKDISNLPAVAEAVTLRPGLQGCLISGSDGLLVAQKGLDEDSESLSAIAPKIIRQVKENMDLVESGPFRTVSIGLKGKLYTIVPSDNVTLTVVHERGRITKTQLAMLVKVAKEIGWLLSHRGYVGPAN